MRLKNKLAIFILLVMPVLTEATSKVILFGGGSTPNSSQVSIELNTHWIHDVINKKPHNIIELFYTDGSSPTVDVRQVQSSSLESQLFEPVSRVYGDYSKNGLYYYSSSFTEQVKPSDRSNLSNAFSEVLTSSTSDDDVFLIYQGHGGYNVKNTNENHLKLWNNSRLTVVELEQLISKTDTEATVRFFLPQCYSGAFNRLIYTNSDINMGLAKGMRCGFVSQREDRISEGCTDSVNKSGYKDYSSYFFSAIDGKTIDKKPIASNPDMDADGSISLYEAHIYSLVNAHSIDYPRSTSEEYLINWQPWYLKWLPEFSDSNNIYTKVGRLIAENLRITDEHLIEATSEMLATNKKEMLSKQEQRNILKVKIKTIQTSIKDDMDIRWPAIKYPYTEQFDVSMRVNIQSISREIKNHESYGLLVEAQDLSKNLKNDLLTLKRNKVQLIKILEMRKLSRISSQFENYATEKEKNQYNKILDCENFVL